MHSAYHSMWQVYAMLGAKGLSPIVAVMAITSMAWSPPLYVTKTSYFHYFSPL